MLETIEGDLSRFNMEIESIQIVQQEPESIGDYDGNRILDAVDLDVLSEAIRSGKTDTQFDLNRDGSVDDGDRSTWVVDLKMTYFGDANLDGEFSSSDLVSVFAVGKYESGEDAGWSEGDWNGDGLFGSSDFVAAFADSGYEKGRRNLAVPESSGVTLILVGLTTFASVRCRARRV